MSDLEIIPNWDLRNEFAVMSWSKSGDAGQIEGVFSNRFAALKFARSLSEKHGYKLEPAEELRFE